ncbi:hypothetical protein GQ457_11G027740 [Hibiscus cannabinus]
MFIDTLKGVLYDRLISHLVVSFANIFTTGERIEDAIRKGKIIIPSNTTPPKGQDSHIHMVRARSTNQPHYMRLQSWEYGSHYRKLWSPEEQGP